MSGLLVGSLFLWDEVTCILEMSLKPIYGEVIGALLWPHLLSIMLTLSPGSCFVGKEFAPDRMLPILVLHVCSGLLPSLIGVCHVAVQFPLYEACKAKMAERQHTTVDHLDPLSVVSTLQYVSKCHVADVCSFLYCLSSNGWIWFSVITYLIQEVCLAKSSLVM